MPGKKNKRFGDEVRVAMLELGGGIKAISLREASRLTDVSYATIHQVVRYDHVPDSDNVYRLAVGFGKDPRDWLTLCGHDMPDLFMERDTCYDPDAAEFAVHLKRVPTDLRPLARRQVKSLLDSFAS